MVKMVRSGESSGWVLVGRLVLAIQMSAKRKREEQTGECGLGDMEEVERENTKCLTQVYGESSVAPLVEKLNEE